VIIPPLLAPTELVIVPIYKSDEERNRVLEVADKISDMLGDWERRDPGRLRVHVDDRDGIKPGAKYYEWELRGVPLRMELGPRDIDKNQGVLVRRDTREKRPISLDTAGEDVSELLTRIQDDLLIAARERREANSFRHKISYDDFKSLMEGKGGFVYAGWCGNTDCESQIKEETKATIRCLPDDEFQSAEPPTSCLKCGAKHGADGDALVEALWAKAY
jgi:prolyl-tRNA synthetase